MAVDPNANGAPPQVAATGPGRDRDDLDDCRGCRGRAASGPPAPPLLRDDLLIAARDRAREPELPAETVAAALAAPIPTETAGYDLVFLAPADVETARRAWALAVEFARREHRVFWLKPETAPERTPRPPALQVVSVPLAEWADAGEGPAMREGLGRLVAERGIAVAALYVPSPKWETVAADARAAWGWRTFGEAHPVEPGLPPIAAGAMPCDLLLDWRADLALDPVRRVALADHQTWPGRWLTVDRALRAAFPRASVVVVAYDNLAFTKLCVASLLANTDYPNWELLLVDNASTDGTPAYLAKLAERFPHVRVIANETNRGFGPANNQALAAGSGDRFVLLNNDTMVPPGWLARLLRHLDDPAVGQIGPATNRTCNEAQIEAPYQTYGEFLGFARERAATIAPERRSIRMPMMFCVAFRRDVYERVGPLDERYEVGMFEDEDYSLRVKALGYDVAWAPAVYVHHAYHASIGKLLPTGDYMRLFAANMERFQEKWGICWERHRPRP